MHEPQNVVLSVEAIRKFQNSLPSHLQHRHIAFLLVELERAQETLRKIAELTKRKQLPLTSEINEIASAALAGQKGE